MPRETGKGTTRRDVEDRNRPHREMPNDFPTDDEYLPVPGEEETPEDPTSPPPGEPQPPPPSQPPPTPSAPVGLPEPSGSAAIQGTFAVPGSPGAKAFRTEDVQTNRVVPGFDAILSPFSDRGGSRTLGAYGSPSGGSGDLAGIMGSDAFAEELARALGRRIKPRPVG